MNGFFVTINCSKILDSNKTFYKIFIRKNEMSIVYELVEWIRFMFGLERCFFLIHEDSVIHELEDISVLEILNSLEIWPCLRSNCIHKKMEKNLFHKLNLFTCWDEMKVHKLFLARCNYIIQRVSKTNHMNKKEKPDCFPLHSDSNSLQVIDKSVLAGEQEAFTPPIKLTHRTEKSRCQGTETMNEDMDDKCHWDFKKTDDKNVNSNEMNMPKEFSSPNLESLTYPVSNNLSLLAENSALNSFGNKKPKLEFNSRKNKMMRIPFSLGAFISSIREEAQSQDFENNEEMKSVNENTENELLHEKKADMDFDKDLLKRKRKRKHKKQRVQSVGSVYPANNLSWDYYEPSVKTKANHIRFNDNDEAVETEAINGVTQEIKSSQLEAKSTGKKNESDENCPAEDEICEKSIDANSERPNDNSQVYSDVERKKLDAPQTNVPDLEALKQKIKHPAIYYGFR